jgi:hypothetical protein
VGGARSGSGWEAGGRAAPLPCGGCQARASPTASSTHRAHPPISLELHGREAQWALRFGPDNRFRACYEIDRESREVYILAIGVKEQDRLFIGGEEVEL